MSPLADRRTRLRYEVVGVLRGTLEMFETVRVQNISGDGALIETSTPVAVGATQSIQMTLDGQSARVTSRVRHVTAIGQSPKQIYAVGVEFVSPPDTLTASVASLIADVERE
jgi:PilZ domain-containing protein